MASPFDSLSRSHPNFFASDLFVTTLVKCGMKHIVLCPGSRNSPLSWAFTRSSSLQIFSCLDERSAGFLALGLAKKHCLPVAVVVTSGTAVANLFPAVVEASESGVPCLMVSADRPPEWQACKSPQTIRQTQIFGSFPVAHYHFPLPEDLKVVWSAYCHQTREAWLQALQKKGPVHLNIPFRKPLVPMVLGTAKPVILTNPICFLGDDWLYEHSKQERYDDNDELLEGVVREDNLVRDSREDSKLDSRREGDEVGGIRKTPNDFFTRIKIVEQTGVIVCGCEGLPQDRDLIELLSLESGFPVLCDVLSNLRVKDNERIISFYDLILRLGNQGNLIDPEVIILVGYLPTSQVLRNWLSKQKGKIFWIQFKSISVNSLHLNARKILLEDRNFKSVFYFSSRTEGNDKYFLNWQYIDAKIRILIQKIPFEPSHWGEVSLVVWLSKKMQLVDNLFIGNSNPVRDFESFFDVEKPNLSIFCNRGANGIDGTLSTAIGIAESDPEQNTLAVLGDLSFLHDSNGLMLRHRMKGSLRILLIDNQGGGIFSTLPAKDFLDTDIFEKYWTTPQKVDWESITKAYHCKYYSVNTFDELGSVWQYKWEKGISIIHVVLDGEKSTSLRKNIFQAITKLDS